MAEIFQADWYLWKQKEYSIRRWLRPKNSGMEVARPWQGRIKKISRNAVIEENPRGCRSLGAFLPVFPQSVCEAGKNVKCSVKHKCTYLC